MWEHNKSDSCFVSQYFVIPKAGTYNPSTYLRAWNINMPFSPLPATSMTLDLRKKSSLIFISSTFPKTPVRQCTSMRLIKWINLLPTADAGVRPREAARPRVSARPRARLNPGIGRSRRLRQVIPRPRRYPRGAWILPAQLWGKNPPQNTQHK